MYYFILSIFIVTQVSCNRGVKTPHCQCLEPPNCAQYPAYCEDENLISAWFEECQPLEDSNLCPSDTICCTSSINGTLRDEDTQRPWFPKNVMEELENFDLEPENRFNSSYYPISEKAFGKKCRGAGGECKSFCAYGYETPDDCWFRKCCKKPPCQKSFWKCLGGDCYQTPTCPANKYENEGGCSTNSGPKCRCCKNCKKKSSQCIGGRCTTETCNSNEVQFNSKCTDPQCHCCQPCRRKFLQCTGGRCTKDTCQDHEVKYLGKCTHQDCHCCGPCKKKFAKCIDGRCTKEKCLPSEVKYLEMCTHQDCHCCGPCKKKLLQCQQGRCTKDKCKSDEIELLDKCLSKDCRCCQSSCPDESCVAAGGKCRQNCLGFYYQISEGKCKNNCQCCKFKWPFSLQNILNKQ